jgi:1,4-dihydroxy-2-naphthoate octaprenyltransferase
MLGRRVGLGLAARGDLRDAVAYAQQAEQRGFASVWLHESYPVGFLVAAILHANEWRDITEDARLGSRTLSSLLGRAAPTRCIWRCSSAPISPSRWPR